MRHLPNLTLFLDINEVITIQKLQYGQKTFQMEQGQIAVGSQASYLSQIKGFKLLGQIVSIEMNQWSDISLTIVSNSSNFQSCQ